MGSPGAAEDDVVLAIKEIRCRASAIHILADMYIERWLTGIRRVDLHGLESFVRHQWRAGPFPDTSHTTLSGKSVAALGDWDGVPVLEPNVAVVEVTEDWHVVW